MHITLDEVNKQKDVMDTVHFALRFGNIPGFSGDSSPMTILCQTASIPGLTIEPVEVGLHGHTVRFRGRKTFSGTMSIGFVETASYEIQRRLRAWNEYCVGTNTSSSGGYKDQYAITAELEVYDVTQKIADRLSIFGVWPSDVPEVQLDGQSAQAMLINPSFTFDYFTSIHHDFR
jgi:hypothetical protein